MSAASLGLLAVAILAEVVATTALKASDGFSRFGPAAVALVLYAGAFYCLSLAMRAVPVGVIYALWSGVGIVLIAVLSRVLYGERLDAAALFGIGLIVTGVLVINLLSKSVSH